MLHIFEIVYAVVCVCVSHTRILSSTAAATVAAAGAQWQFVLIAALDPILHRLRGGAKQHSQHSFVVVSFVCHSLQRHFARPLSSLREAKQTHPYTHMYITTGKMSQHHMGVHTH